MAALNCQNQTVFIGDNLPIMRGLNSGCADLICADPPFNKKKRFNHNFGKSRPSKKKPGFDDYWTMDDVRKEEHELLNARYPKLYHLCASARNLHSPEMQAYLVMMAVRLMECHRLLAETGSLYLHCDPTANAYLRLMLDGIFGQQNFRNEIVWQRTKSGKSSQHKPRSFGRNTDAILFYSKSDAYPFHPFKKLSDAEAMRLFPKVDGNGNRYALRSLYRGRTLGMRPNLCYKWRGFVNPHPSGWALSKERLEEEYQKGNVVIKPNGKLERRQYLYDSQGGYLSNLWYDIPNASTSERSGWATQKPLALYSRMVLASSNPGDVVLDPFCGCATTLVAAENAGRKWLGIDREPEAANMIVQQFSKCIKTKADWRNQIRIIRHCDNQRKEFPVRTDLGEFEHYKKHFDRLYTEQAGICAGCDKHYDANVMQVDHDFPRVKGGQDNIENLQVLCSSCNSRKGTKRLAQLREINRRLGLMKKETQ